NQGDFRAEDGLRAPEERSLYFSDPDTNKLQLTALGTENWSLISNEEKWKRTADNREKLGRGLSRFDRGAKSSEQASPDYGAASLAAVTSRVKVPMVGDFPFAHLA